MAYTALCRSRIKVQSRHVWPAASATRGRGGSALWFIFRCCQCLNYIESNDVVHGWRIRKNLEGSGHGPVTCQKVLREATKHLNQNGRSESSTSQYTYIYCQVNEWLQTGFGLVIKFIEHLQNVTTSNYSAFANSHTLQFTTARTISQYAVALPVVAR
jgi:hypothetical protein